ncbi:hypothetical protein [Mucilaginibacter gossypiicola]|uniref:hypothetical protein n=1 Tax=Mucilaginibacter gossypiicola TaxID=551995 RepID=UPI00115FB7AC|nr:hypothetical protein [Mucilaginibacter gossypiicola]
MIDFITWALPSARAVRSYYTGLSHRPVSAPIPNATQRTISKTYLHAITIFSRASLVVIRNDVFLGYF